MPARSLYIPYGKRGLDLLLAILALPVAVLVGVPLALLLALHFRGNPFFTQRRIGYREKPFMLVKFRTMRHAFDAHGNPLPDAARLTWLGRWVRRLSLDELPQLLLVVTGYLSWVGPRPLLPQYLTLYSARQRLRHTVKPGITGWAQVQGRNNVPWPQRLEHDAWYAQHQSFKLDLSILVRTVALVVQGGGVAAPGQATMQPFTGKDIADGT
jgi:lipopolysaccharide/colanic/teichoic acid biosynthesis glycosyltransferase